MSLLFTKPLLKSLRSLPYSFWTFKVMVTALWRNSAICSKSFSTNPLEVMAGAPILTPPGAKALLSPNTAFLFTVMLHRSQSFSTLFPVNPRGRRSQRTRWFSVPPVTSLYPLPIK
uniref:Uncharacterized protein n=1 Tax=Opuntia streptacantha TaxID=393608 RepID=A0A7C9E3M6_OPUST